MAGMREAKIETVDDWCSLSIMEQIMASYEGCESFTFEDVVERFGIMKKYAQSYMGIIISGQRDKKYEYEFSHGSPFRGGKYKPRRLKIKKINYFGNPGKSGHTKRRARNPMDFLNGVMK